MEHYECLHCGYVFSEPAHLLPERLEHFGTPCTMSGESVCPVCGSDDFEEMHHCRNCGEMARELENGLCKDCMQALANRLRDFLAGLSDYELEAFYDLSERAYFEARAEREAKYKNAS